MNLKKICLVPAVTLMGVGLAGAAVAQLPDTVAAGPYALRLQIVWMCAAVAAVVYAVMIYGLAVAKRPRGSVASSCVGSRHAELLWAVIPAMILIGLALPAVDTLASLVAETQQSPVIADSSPGP
jgi:heme/copper-type cytochrome/quinol oxidase subunit 2